MLPPPYIATSKNKQENDVIKITNGGIDCPIALAHPSTVICDFTPEDL